MQASDAFHPDAALASKLESIFALRPEIKVDLSLRPEYADLLTRLGNPHRRLPPTVHVAGTNGKGSSIAIMRAVLEAAGYSVHVYTSPHLVAFNERIVLAGKEISGAALSALIDEVMGAGHDLPLTFFEVTTALAFLAFSRTAADALLLETGLGGRLDCTNIIENPAVTLITRISADHKEFLGDTLERIAGEKAGIMKAGAPCVIGPQSLESVNRVFEKKAESLSCPLYREGSRWGIKGHDRVTMRYRFGSAEFTLPRPALTGDHQLENAGAALTCLRLLPGFSFPAAAIERGLAAARWPARLQRLSGGRLSSLLPEGWELWLDGGHNEDAGRVVAGQAGRWREEEESATFSRNARTGTAPAETPTGAGAAGDPAPAGNRDPRPLHLVLGMMRRKDPAGYIAHVAPYLASLTTIPVPGSEGSALSAGELALIARDTLPAGSPCVIRQAESLEEILPRITARGAPGRILIAGSLYLAGHVLGKEGG